LALQKKDREIVLHGYESGRIVRLPGGAYIEVHQPVDHFDRFKLVDNEHYEPLIVRPNAKGRIGFWQNTRAAMSRWFFEDRLLPMTQSELDAAVAHQHHSLEEMETIENEEIQGAHERAGHPEAPLHPVDDSATGEVPVRPTTVLAPDEAPDAKRPKKKDHDEDGK
ncbi:MAG: ubiquinol-cytochrome c reductase cytochrome b subunit, partial [Microbacterium sp.]|nr:ubiquinol-cytochrome c reductase cytochrome b subunit [Microbacterium sp.]